MDFRAMRKVNFSRRKAEEKTDGEGICLGGCGRGEHVREKKEKWRKFIAETQREGEVIGLSM